MISSGGMAVFGRASIAPILLSNIKVRLCSQVSWSCRASLSFGLRSRTLLTSSSAPEKSLSATSSRAPRIQTSVSLSGPLAGATASLWIDQAPFPPSPLTTPVATTSAAGPKPSQPLPPSSESAEAITTITASAAPRSPVNALAIMPRVEAAGTPAGRAAIAEGDGVRGATGSVRGGGGSAALAGRSSRAGAGGGAACFGSARADGFDEVFSSSDSPRSASPSIAGAAGAGAGVAAKSGRSDSGAGAAARQGFASGISPRSKSRSPNDGAGAAAAFGGGGGALAGATAGVVVAEGAGIASRLDGSGASPVSSAIPNRSSASRRRS